MGRAHEVRAASMAKTAAAKSKLNAKWSRAIYVAAKAGIPDPALNQALKKEIEKAKREQVSADAIKRAIDKAKGGAGESYDSERYEGFGPGNSIWIVDCLTDNHNRTLTSIRTAFSRTGGNLGTSGSVSHMFKNQTVISYEATNGDEVLEVLLENDCDVEDVQVDDGVLTIYAPATEYSKIKEVLDKTNPDVEYLEDHTTYIPSSYVKLTDEHEKSKYDRFMEMLDECDDVQEIYNNVEFDDDQE